MSLIAFIRSLDSLITFSKGLIGLFFTSLDSLIGLFFTSLLFSLLNLLSNPSNFLNSSSSLNFSSSLNSSSLFNLLNFLSNSSNFSNNSSSLLSSLVLLSNSSSLLFKSSFSLRILYIIFKYNLISSFVILFIFFLNASTLI